MLFLLSSDIVFFQGMELIAPRLSIVLDFLKCKARFLPLRLGGIAKASLQHLGDVRLYLYSVVRTWTQWNHGILSDTPETD